MAIRSHQVVHCLLRVVGLVRQLRRVPDETILLAEVSERQRQLVVKLNATPTPISESIQRMLRAPQDRPHQLSEGLARSKADYRHAIETTSLSSKPHAFSRPWP